MLPDHGDDRVRRPPRPSSRRGRRLHEALARPARARDRGRRSRRASCRLTPSRPTWPSSSTPWPRLQATASSSRGTRRSSGPRAALDAARAWFLRARRSTLGWLVDGGWPESRRGDRVLQHGDDGPPAILGEWLDERGIEHEVHSTWREPLPSSPGDYGWIASLGSEHTPGAEGAPSWVDAEIEFLRRSLALEVAGARPLLRRPGPGPRRRRRSRALGATGDRLDRGRDQRSRADPAGALAAFPLRPARPAAGLRGGRLVAGRAGGLRPRRLARAPVPPRVDARDRRRVGAARTPRSSTRLGIDGAGLLRRRRDGARAASISLFDAWWELAAIPPPTRNGYIIQDWGGRAEQPIGPEEEHVNPQTAASTDERRRDRPRDALARGRHRPDHLPRPARDPAGQGRPGRPSSAARRAAGSPSAGR